MSWHCSRVLAEAFSEATSLAGAPSVPSSTTPTPEAFYWPGKTTEHSRLSRFGMMSEPLTADRGEDLLTWFREAFLAKTSVPQDEVMGLTVSAVGSGRKWLGLLARFDHDSLSWKTPQCSLVEGLDEFSETWPRWGSMRNGECWERMTADSSTDAKESGSLLPTPSGCRSGKNHVAGRMDEWGGSSNPFRKTEIGSVSSPDFEEWVMGWPERWTVLMPLETDKFQRWQQQHGES